jgi:hypothetical protein
MFEVTEAWRVAYPDAHAGFLGSPAYSGIVAHCQKIW